MTKNVDSGEEVLLYNASAEQRRLGMHTRRQNLYYTTRNEETHVKISPT